MFGGIKDSTTFDSMDANKLIIELLTLAIKSETSLSLKVRQVSKMKAGKVRKELNQVYR